MTLKQNTSLSYAEMPWVMQKINEIKQHPAWNEHIKDEAQSESALLGKPVFTFLLRPGKDTEHYFLSFVEADGAVYHKQVRILLSPRGWLYQNGGSLIRESINDLVPAVLHCSFEQCKPLRAPRAPLFSLN
ncbi:MAG: SH2 domain-containing protein [Chlamydiales bacterium]